MVADRIITQMKVEQHQVTYDKVKIGNEDLENVYRFVYLGAEIPSDGDPEIPVKHRCDIVWGRFSEYQKTLMATKLPFDMRTRLFNSLIAFSMTYSCEAWMMTPKINQKVNGVNSKMLSLITNRSIHDEAKTPTFDIENHIMDCRWDYLGHILRMDPNRALRRFLLELSLREALYTKGSLLSDSNFQTVGEMIEAAEDRDRWRIMKNERIVDGWESHASLWIAASR